MMIFAKNNNLNFAVVVKLLGMLLLIEAAFMLPSAIVSFAYHETAAMWSFIYSIAITVGAGALGFLLPVRNHDMGRREGFLLTSLTWGGVFILRHAAVHLRPVRAACSRRLLRNNVGTHHHRSIDNGIG